jgi:iron-sulfur cluster assembly protein
MFEKCGDGEERNMVNISESAGEKIQEMLAAEETPNLFLRIGVNEGGCSGFSYGMGFDDERHSDDKEYDIRGLKVVVDGESAKYLYGVEIDWKESAMGGGFTIQNPNAVATCGCGSSFRTATDAGKPNPDAC